MSKHSKSSTDRICCFCGSAEENEIQLGKIYEHGGIITHYYCLLLSSNMAQKGTDTQGILGFLVEDIRKEIRRGKRLACAYCKKTGATLGCCNSKCKKIFHYPCGLRAGTLSQFYGQFRSYCVKHRPIQKVDDQVISELAKSNNKECCICYEKVSSCDKNNTMWAPCCKKNAWFHRKCVQQLAISAGYFFKCPLCNNKQIFQTEMKEYGIFVPSQDASWELVPNAFEELLYRHNRCDAPKCLCPKGRKYTSHNARWELALCRTCGSQGIHMACGQLKWANPVWECTECVSIIGKFARTSSSSSSSTEDTLQNRFDSEDSNSDISVGNNSPTPSSSCTSPILQMPIIRQRPGPRTFKLRQLAARKKAILENLCNYNEQQINESTSISQNIESNAKSKEQHNLQSTSSKELSTNTSNVLLNMLESRDNIILTGHSKVDTDVNSIIIVDSDDDDILEIKNSTLLDDTLSISKDNKSEKNYSIQSEYKLHENNILKDNELLQENILKQNNNVNNLLTRDLSTIEIDNSKNKILENQIDSNDLDSSEVECATDDPGSDLMSNIQITNVISLAPEEFEKTSSVESWESNGFKESTLENNSVSIGSNLVPQSLSLENGTLELNSKRKFDDVTLTPILANEPKKVKANNEVSEESLQPSHVPLETVSDLSHENNLSPHMQFKETDARKSLRKKSSNTDCDGHAGSSPASESGNTSFVDSTRIICTGDLAASNDSKSRKLHVSERCKLRANIPMTSYNKFSDWQRKDRNRDCNYSRLIPEYIRLRDLKFRVHNGNNLQMTLCNKFSVNITMNCTTCTTKLNDTVDASVKNIVKQNNCKSQNETFLSVKSGSILQSISTCNKEKSKYMFMNEHFEKYQDDTKENLDPITSPCRNVTDNLLPNATLITSNSNVSTNNNSNRQNENENFTQPVSNEIKDNDTEQSHENISLNDNTKNNFDTKNSSKLSNIIRDAKQDVRNFNSNYVKSSACEMTVRHILSCKNHTNENENQSDLKVSIDLKKIKNFVDSNPTLFSCEKIS